MASLPSTPATLKLDSAVMKKIADPWTDTVPAAWEGLDFSWFAELSRFSHWDLDDNSPVSLGPPALMPVTPLPEFTHLLGWSRLHLARALSLGDPVRAAAEVQHLAALCATTETLVGVMVAVALLGLEDDARLEAQRREITVPPEWKTLDKPSRTRLKAMFFAGPAYLQLDTPARYQSDFERVTAGRCAAFNETLGLAWALRPALHDGRAEQYARLTAMLDGAKGCRLTHLRKVWHAADASSLFDNTALCGNPDDCGSLGMLSFVPGYESLVAENLLTVASPRWFGKYDDAP
jgi:hypothetical protein